MRKKSLLITVSTIILVSCTPIPAAITPTSYPSPTIPQIALPTSATPCTLFHTPVTPQAALSADLEIRGHVSGPADAPVTIIVFSDYQCFPCAFLAASLKQIRLAHPKDVRLIYLDAPQSNRDKDTLAIQVVDAADSQGKFWEMHDLLFEKQAEWVKLTQAEFSTWAVGQATGLGLDEARYRSDVDSKQVNDRVQLAIKSVGDKPFVTPILYVNSTSPYTSFADFASLDTVVRLDALVTRQFTACPPQNIIPLHQYIVTLHTSKGDVILQLFPDKAPLAVNNFIFLARNGWYNGNTFYKVIPGEKVMTGDPSGTGLGNPGYLFETESADGLSFDKAGMLAMDNDGPGTNGSRFFIILNPNPQMNGQFTIIGQVLNGMDVLSALTPRNPRPGLYLPPGDVLTSVDVEER